MPKIENARDEADAVRQFARTVGRHGPAPERIQVRVGGGDGLTTLCAAEAAIRDLLPATTARELVWLSRGQAGGEGLHLQAYASGGELVGEAVFRLMGSEA
jgi:hypothetical protein